eukprot:16239182-Heterocapsa_arctica.AAC.1
MRNSLQHDPPLAFEISTDETLEAIASMAKGKTCGSDGVVAEMLQALDGENVAMIGRMLTGRARGYIHAPHDWRSIASACFPKVESPSRTADLRPIAFISVLM